MPVDKFGRNCQRTTTVYTGINIANITVFKEEMEVIPQFELLI